jgi:hypothetical protein
MALQRGIDGAEPLPPDPAGPAHRELRINHRTEVATGTLACPQCDAPALPDGPMSPAAELVCAFCDHAAVLRDFLSLEPPTRPTRVVVRIAATAGRGRRPRSRSAG